MLNNLFADDASLFSTVYVANHSAKVLTDNLNKISELAYKWKMLFNPDLTKKPPEVFSHKKILKLTIQLFTLMCLRLCILPVKNMYAFR